jgi:hypothetical protein
MSNHQNKKRYENSGRPPGDRIGRGYRGNYYDTEYNGRYDGRGYGRGDRRQASTWRSDYYYDNRHEHNNAFRGRGRGGKYPSDRTGDGRVKKPSSAKKPPSERLADTLGKFAHGGDAPIFFDSPADPHTGFLHIEFKSTFEDDDGWSHDSVEMYMLVHEARSCSEDPKLWKRILQASKAEDRRKLVEATDFRRLFKTDERFRNWEDGTLTAPY